MRRFLCSILVLSVCFCSSRMGLAVQTSGSEKPSTAQQPNQATVYGMRPETVNVFVQHDERLFAVMTALNIAGYDYESGGQALSPIRKQLRQELAGLDPDLRAQLTAAYKDIVGAGSSASPRVGGFVGLSLVLSPPPSLALSPRRQTLPADVSDAARLLPLVREFYARSGVSKLAGPSLASTQDQLTAVRETVSVLIYQILNYLHTVPILSLERRSTRKQESDVPTKPRLRTRRLYVVLNPLDASDSAYVRNDILNGADADADRLPGDDYFVIVGSASTIDPVQLAFLRFVLEPLGEKNALAIREQSPLIGHLAEKIVGQETAKQFSAFSIVNESLVQAVHYRLRRLRVQNFIEQKLASEKLPQEKLVAERAALEKAADEDVIADLSSHYEQGAVLVFHFYDRMVRAEQVGVDIASYYEDMVRGVNFEREGNRAGNYRDVRARVEARRSVILKPVVANVSPLIEKLTMVDALAKDRKFEQAQAVLQELVKQYPNNARVIYGQAQLMNQMARQIDPSKSADEDAAWEKLMSQLEQTVQFYRRAIGVASPQDEKWLISQSHVAIGRILEFANQRDAADVEYQKAIELGDVPGGAYAQAKERLGTKNGK